MGRHGTAAQRAVNAGGRILPIDHIEIFFQQQPISEVLPRGSTGTIALHRQQNCVASGCSGCSPLSPTIGSFEKRTE